MTRILLTIWILGSGVSGLVAFKIAGRSWWSEFNAKKGEPLETEGALWALCVAMLVGLIWPIATPAWFVARGLSRESESWTR